jgi:ABC-2 type transport system ATP-binding protein
MAAQGFGAILAGLVLVWLAGTLHGVSDVGLAVDRVWKSYGAVVALRELAFDVRPGELFGFVGSNGAGKTTAMRVILGVLEADAGEVRWQGEPMTLAVRRRIGYMPEQRGLYPKMKIGDQLVYLAELHGMSSGQAIAAMRRWTERLGVAARQGDEVQKLSLGNQQRVQLAASLIHDPAILVLDEPFTGLDPVAVDVMSEVLREKAAEGIPVLFSSHQLDLVERLCDRVGIIRSGEMVAVGSVDELRAGAAVQLAVQAPQASPGWTDGLAGVRVISRGTAETVLELDAGADDPAVLRAALATGPVRSFGYRRPSLTELFRHVVRQETAS